ncbi:MAG: hypothetical protein GPJ51_06680 [Candidatus Heimdallarchaeota archaeon]|nr:hypothetical protein [Candidatus Heimdallarchaeota archaeon]
MSKDKTHLKPKDQKVPALTTMWIGLIVGLLGLIGTMITGLAESEEWLFMLFIGVLVAGFFILFFSIILRRIKRKGIDYFVLGAITAYLGFLMLALPTVIYIITFKMEDFGIEPYIFFVIMGFGVLLIIFGFFIEAYDLNEKLLELFRRIGESLRKMLQRIKWKLVLSPWNFLSIAGIIVIVLTAVDVLPLYIYYLIGGGLILINIIIHLRREIAEMLKDLGKILLTLLQSWWRGIKYIPKLIVRLAKFLYDPERFKRMVRWVKAKLIAIFTWIGEAFKFIFVRNYLLLFVLGIVIFFLLFYKVDNVGLEVSLSISALVCGVAIIKPIIDWRENFGEGISKARLFLYKTGQKSKKILRIRSITRCPHCMRPNPITRRECWNCKKDMPRCLICNNIVERETEISRCKSCDNIFHVKHLKTWLRFNPKCPVCHQEMKKIKTEVFKPPLEEDQITENFDKQSIDTIPDTEDLTQGEIEKLEKLEVESAFVTCNHCKNKVSSVAKFCSICGNPMDPEE